MKVKNLFNYGDTVGIISCSDGISMIIMQFNK